jgi:uncharacterized protein (DUF4415 family)
MKVKNLKNRSHTNWERLSTMTEKEINLSDSPELDDSFFENATLLMPEPKKSVSLRIDKDVLDWYKHQGPGYQTRINAVLRMYMRAQNKPITKMSSRKTSTLRKSVKKA